MEAACRLLYVMRLSALPEVRFAEDLDERDARHLAVNLHHFGGINNFVQGVVLADKPYEGDLVDQIRASIVEDYRDSVFSDKHESDPPVRGPHGEATIELKPGVTPSKIRPYQMKGERGEAWRKMIDDLEKAGKIEDGLSPWNSPFFVVSTKVLNKYYLVVQYRRLNDATITDAHPLPLIEDILNRQGKVSIWSVLDMKDGYHQIPLKPEHRQYTCMGTPARQSNGVS